MVIRWDLPQAVIDLFYFPSNLCIIMPLCRCLNFAYLRVYVCMSVVHNRLLFTYIFICIYVYMYLLWSPYNIITKHGPFSLKKKLFFFSKVTLYNYNRHQHLSFNIKININKHEHLLSRLIKFYTTLFPSFSFFLCAYVRTYTYMCIQYTPYICTLVLRCFGHSNCQLVNEENKSKMLR